MISVAIATHNRDRYLVTSLQSVIAQAGCGAHEIVVVDDGSTDGTEEVVKMFQWVRPIRYIKIQHGGIPVARNVCVRESTGDLICIVDDDDIQLPGRLRLHEEADRPGVSGSYGGWIDFDDGTGSLTPCPGKPHSLAAVLFTGKVLCHGVSCIRRDVLLEFPYNEQIPYGSDYDLAVRMAEAGHKMVHVGSYMMLRRIHVGNVTTTDTTSQRGAAREAVATLVAGIPADRAAQMRAEAKQLRPLDLRSPFGG